MFVHNLNPVLINFGFIEIRWYSLAYIFGILIGWWLAKKIIIFKIKNNSLSYDLKIFDDLISIIILSIIVGGRIGYIIFYNLGYYLSNPIDIFKIWEGGMSFHGALIGIIIGTYLFSKKNNIKTGICSGAFMFFYGLFRIISEQFREPDLQIGYLFNLLSMGTFLSIIMVLAGIYILINSKNANTY